MTRNRSAVAESLNQIALYRNYLRDQSAVNLWRHMALGDSQDTGHWSIGLPRPFPVIGRLILITFSTRPGNGWAAAGMLRVYGTIKNSEYAADFKSEQNDLIDWIIEIQDGMYTYLVRSLATLELRHLSRHFHP